MSLFATPFFRFSTVAAVVLLAASAHSAAQAQVPASAAPERAPTELQVSGSLRFWSANWSSWYTNPNVMVGTTRYTVVEVLDNGSRVAPIASIGLRYGKLSLSASALLDTTYSFDTATFRGDNSRREADITLGYMLAPGINLTLGRKQIDQTVSQADFENQSATATGPVLGVNASAPVSSSWGLYGNFSKGVFKYQLPTRDINGNSRFDTDYQLLEAGFTYDFPTTRWMRRILLTAGFRTQRMAIKSYGLEATPQGQPTQVHRRADLVDITQGFVLGLQGTF